MTAMPQCAALRADAYDDRVVVPALQMALGLDEPGAAESGTYFNAEAVDLDTYDNIIVCLSAGKDSIACMLHLIDEGVDLAKVELWHHDVDGGGPVFMDWPQVPQYTRSLAHYFDVPVYFSWLEGGFEGEMLKQDAYGKPHKVETPTGLLTLERDTKRAQPGTRMRFPQMAADLKTRWCSGALKVDPGRRALTNQDRFDGKRVLFITGERRQESPMRSRYMQLEPHACDRRKGRKARHVDAWRPVLNWGEDRVWDTFRRHRIIAPVPYRLGWSRSSCQTCIYNSGRIWATVARYFPERAAKIEAYERQFGVTISRTRQTVLEIASRYKPFEIDDLEALDQATREDYTLPVALPQGVPWKLPVGAFGKEGCGSV